MKARKKKNTYIREFFNILIDILFITIFVAIGFGIYKFIYWILHNISNISTLYGTLISVSVTIMLALISYIVKIKRYMPILLHKFKQRTYQFFLGDIIHFLCLQLPIIIKKIYPKRKIRVILLVPR